MACARCPTLVSDSLAPDFFASAPFLRGSSLILSDALRFVRGRRRERERGDRRGHRSVRGEAGGDEERAREHAQGDGERPDEADGRATEAVGGRWLQQRRRAERGLARARGPAAGEAPTARGMTNANLERKTTAFSWSFQVVLVGSCVCVCVRESGLRCVWREPEWFLAVQSERQRSGPAWTRETQRVG
eukprot:2218791-Rhodomonas_salina.1